jgi:uncharacterized BrkB/YihY/UPF0761 family membrane protein
MARKVTYISGNIAYTSMLSLVAITLVALLASTTTSSAGFAAKSCAEAIRNHHVAQAGTKAALANYDVCTSRHFGMDGCTNAFAILRAAQKAYAGAVSEYAVQCGQ